jgi:hypothetical protein
MYYSLRKKGSESGMKINEREMLTKFSPGNYIILINPSGIDLFLAAIAMPGAFNVMYSPYTAQSPEDGGARPGEENGMRVTAIVTKLKTNGAAATWYFGPEVLAKMQKLFDKD